MSEPDRILHLINEAVTAVVTGGDTALDDLLHQLDDDDLQALIDRLAIGIGFDVRFLPDRGQR